jgi:hypothetical protein
MVVDGREWSAILPDYFMPREIVLGIHCKGGYGEEKNIPAWELYCNSLVIW